MSICYANRSAVYYELSLFDLCLENIELARIHQLPDRLKAKLDQRQKAAVIHLLSKLVVKPKCSYNMKLCRPPMRRQPFFVNCLGIESNQIITKEPLIAGDVISLEKPWSQILRPNYVYERCSYCLTNKKYMSLIPCKCCTMAMFCENYCYQMAHKMYHSYECSIIDGLYHVLPDLMYLGLRTVLISLNEFGGLSDEYRKLLMRCMKNYTNPFEINIITKNRSYQEMIYMIIYNLNRNFPFSMQHHLATVLLVEQLKSKFQSIFDYDPGLQVVLSTSLFHMIQVSMENGILLEETSVDDDDIRVYGFGLFPFASNFNLSCAPNVLFVNCSGILSGTVLCPIKAGGAIKPGIM